MSQKHYSTIATEYCERVVSGEQIANKWIKLAAQRYLDDLSASGRWFYDPQKVERCCAFIETLPLSNGNLFILSPHQVWIVASLIGFVDKAGTRKYIEAFLLIAKGNGKSPLAAALGLWFAFFDGRKNAEVYCGALSKVQAHEVFTPARQFVDDQPGFAKLGIEAQKSSIFSLKGGGSFRPVVGKGRHGARPYLAILDELHQAISDDLYGTFKTGCNKTPNSLLLVISTAGVTGTQNICYRLQEQAQKAIDGSLPNERLFVALYCADDSVPWDSEEALQMANPNLGISNDAEKLRIAIQDAKRTPAHENNVKAMHLCIWSAAASKWLNTEAWKACYDPDLTEESVKHLPCFIGSDIASVLDLSAMVRLYRDDSKGDKPHFYVLTRAYLPSARVNDPSNSHYQMWSKQGYLIETEGSSIDYSKLEADAIADCKNFKVQEFCYDKRYADQFSQQVSEKSGIVRVETPPSPSVLSPAMKAIDAAIADGRLHHDNHAILTWCMSNVLTHEKASGDYSMPEKSKPENKIDCAMALFIAMTRAVTFTAPKPKASFKPFFL